MELACKKMYPTTWKIEFAWDGKMVRHFWFPRANFWFLGRMFCLASLGKTTFSLGIKSLPSGIKSLPNHFSIPGINFPCSRNIYSQDHTSLSVKSSGRNPWEKGLTKYVDEARWQVYKFLLSQKLITLQFCHQIQSLPWLNPWLAKPKVKI